MLVRANDTGWWILPEEANPPAGISYSVLGAWVAPPEGAGADPPAFPTCELDIPGGAYPGSVGFITFTLLVSSGEEHPTNAKARTEMVIEAKTFFIYF